MTPDLGAPSALQHVENIRVGLERAGLAKLEALLPESRAKFASPKMTAARRRELTGSALLLTDAMAPSLYAAAREALANLGVSDRVELYQARGEPPNAYAVIPKGPIALLFVGDFAADFADKELVALIGHEVGHCLSHMTNDDYAWARASTHAEYTNLPAHRDPRVVGRPFLRASELTADRFALLASKSLGASLRLQMRGVAGNARAIALDPKGYLAQSRELAEAALAAGTPMLGTTHPEHLLRAYATWLFWESDLYKALSGSGPGKRDVREVDATLHRLIDPSSVPATRVASKVPQAITAPAKSKLTASRRRRLWR